MEDVQNSRAEVSVFILVYNDPHLIGRAVESVLQQTYPKIKVILLDNGSTDQTPMVLERFLTDPRVSIVTNPKNQRSEFAVRQALKSRSPYLTFLFSDDWYERSRVEEMVNAMELRPDTDAVFANCQLVDDEGIPLTSIPPTLFGGDITQLTPEQHLHHFLFQGNSLHPCGMLIRTETYLKLGGFPPYLHRIGDMTFFARLLGQARVQFLSERLQNITVLKSQRNESAANSINYAAVALERCRFLAEYRSPELLSKMGQILPEFSDRITREPATALFWLGWRLFQIPAQDLKLFGMKCMYDAFDQSGELIDRICEENFGVTFSQYCYAIHEGQQSRLSKRYFKFRRFVLGLPGGKRFVDTLRPLVRG